MITNLNMTYTEGEVCPICNKGFLREKEMPNRGLKEVFRLYLFVCDLCDDTFIVEHPQRKEFDGRWGSFK